MRVQERGRGQMTSWLVRAEVRKVSLPSRAVFWAVQLVRIIIKKGQGNEKVRNI